MAASNMKCCCGRAECAYLEHNSAALAELERDVETAARLGQALLYRHESYKAESESNRHRMTVEMEKLELRKREVEAENARVVEENRALLDQLEKLNHLLTESDAQVRTLTTTLQSTQLEVRRLSSSTKRVEQLEEQLLQLESEQAQLEGSLLVTQESENAAIQRWRKAECALGDLHDQLDRIEREARQEREKHIEMIGRLERRRMVERELDVAAGRIKGAAVSASLSRGGSGTNVVSHFVRDILKDNANLQQCVAELKGMLQDSNEDVRYLRDQLQLHQPLAPSSIEEYSHNNLLPLSEELEEKSPELKPQEIHVHHHFHSPIQTPPRKERHSPAHRRQKKRKPILPPTLHETFPKDLSMTQAMHRPTNSTSSVSSVFSLASSSLPQYGTATALSSIPSSPLSGYRTSSIFDRHDPGFDSSRPTSPESMVFSSPRYKPSHRPKLSDASFRSICEADEVERGESPVPVVEHIDQPLERKTEEICSLEDGGADNCLPEAPLDNHHENRDPQTSARKPENIILEKPTDALTAVSQSQGDITEVRPDFSTEASRPSCSRLLRHSDSHESLISVSGMDIHTSTKHPGLKLGAAPVFIPRPPKRVSYTGTIYPSPKPIISKTNAVVHRASLTGEQTSVSLLSSVVAPKVRLTREVPDNASYPQSDTVSTISASSEPLPSRPALPIRAVGIGKRMGGWVLDKWSKNTVDGLEVHAASLPGDTFMARTPGVNQIGPILGLRPPPPAPISLHPENLNHTLLQESLLE